MPGQQLKNFKEILTNGKGDCKMINEKTNQWIMRSGSKLATAFLDYCPLEKWIADVWDMGGNLLMNSECFDSRKSAVEAMEKRFNEFCKN